MAVVACLKKADAKLILFPQLKQNAPPSHNGLENTALSARRFIDKFANETYGIATKVSLHCNISRLPFWHVRI